MDGIIRLNAEQRKTAMDYFRTGTVARVARRAHILILLDDGLSYRKIMEVMHCGSDLIANVKRRMLADGFEAALKSQPTSKAEPPWISNLCVWTSWHTPQDFGYFRSRWSCEILSQMLFQEQSILVSGECVRQWMHQIGYVWRRPRPVVGPEDPFYSRKLQRIRNLLNNLPEGHVAVFQDEVDINLNPKIGSQWMARGMQIEVETPGNNVKLYLAGSLIWNTGRLIVSEPQTRRNSSLFIDHLEDLRYRLRTYTKIHVICDNAAFHKSKMVMEYLEDWKHRLELHFLPAYSPETNPIERVWWHLHETITRNHRCKTLDELVTLAYDWFSTNNNHYADMRNTFALAA